jgi:hypothetical protein
MRVKLSYTVEDEDVLAESAKLINLSAQEVQLIIDLFNSIQVELRGENDDDKIVNVNRCLEMVEEFRKALYSIDLRLGEVGEIIMGYDEYRRGPKDSDAEEAPLNVPELLENQGAMQETEEVLKSLLKGMSAPSSEDDVIGEETE